MARHPEDSRRSKWTVQVDTPSGQSAWTVETDSQHGQDGIPSTTRQRPQHSTTLPSDRLTLLLHTDARPSGSMRELGSSQRSYPGFQTTPLLETGRRERTWSGLASLAVVTTTQILCKISTMCRPLGQSGPRINMNPFPALTRSVPGRFNGSARNTTTPSVREPAVTTVLGGLTFFVDAKCGLGSFNNPPPRKGMETSLSSSHGE